MSNCIYSFQNQAPDESYYIMSGFPKIPVTTGQPLIPGCVLTAANSFPASAEIRWMEMDSAMFVSVDPASQRFLEPNWNDTLVQKYVLHQGW